MTHHDAFGTAESWVNTMYETHLKDGFDSTLEILIDGIQLLVFHFSKMEEKISNCLFLGN